MEIMKEHSRMLTRPWILLVAGVVLIVAHALVLRFALPHKALSAAVVAGVMILVLIKHLGLLSSVYTLFRRRSRN
jgi:hypothetical protein